MTSSRSLDFYVGCFAWCFILIVISLPLISAECRVTGLVGILQPDIFAPGVLNKGVRQIH